MLVADGLISRRPGRGTRPLHAQEWASAGMAALSQTKALKGLLPNVVDIGLNTTVRVLDNAVVTASSSVAEALRIRVGEAVCKSVRIRSYRPDGYHYPTTGCEF
jgi:GntR family transcriptional regulator